MRAARAKVGAKVAEDAIFFETVQGMSRHLTSKYDKPTARVGLQNPTVDFKGRFAEVGRAVNLRKYPLGRNFRNYKFHHRGTETQWKKSQKPAQISQIFLCAPASGASNGMRRTVCAVG